MAKEASEESETRCPACGFGNAVATLYCQDCGARLPVAPPSYLAGPAASAAQTPGGGTPAPAQGLRPAARIRPDRPRIPLGNWIGGAVRALVFAALAAVLIQILRPPSTLPAPETPYDEGTISGVLSRLLESSQKGETVDAPWPRINAYLVSRLVNAKSPPLEVPPRVGLLYRPNGFEVVNQRRVAGIPLVFRTGYVVISRTRGLSAKPNFASVGRMPLPPAFAPISDWLAGDLAAVFRTELEILAGAGGISFSPKSAALSFASTPP